MSAKYQDLKSGTPKKLCIIINAVMVTVSILILPSIFWMHSHANAADIRFVNRGTCCPAQIDVVTQEYKVYSKTLLGPGQEWVLTIPDNDRLNRCRVWCPQSLCKYPQGTNWIELTIDRQDQRLPAGRSATLGIVDNIVGYPVPGIVVQPGIVIE